MFGDTPGGEGVDLTPHRTAKAPALAILEYRFNKDPVAAGVTKCYVKYTSDLFTND